MEVGHECIDLSKMIGRVDENGGGVGAWSQVDVGLESAHGGGADGEEFVTRDRPL